MRGLDYYRHTAFEFVTDQLGAQGTVIAGGRYDGLIEQLGGPHTPAVGWAAGIERLAMLIDAPPAEAVTVCVIPDDPAYEAEASRITAMLRGAQIPVEMAFRGNAKRRIELARKHNAETILFIRHPGPSTGGLYLKHLRGMADRQNEVWEAVRAALLTKYGSVQSGTS